MQGDTSVTNAVLSHKYSAKSITKLERFLELCLVKYFPVINSSSTSYLYFFKSGKFKLVKQTNIGAFHHELCQCTVL